MSGLDSEDKDLQQDIQALLVLPPLTSYYLDILKDLNWLARRLPLLVSFAGGQPYLLKDHLHHKTDSKSTTKPSINKSGSKKKSGKSNEITTEYIESVIRIDHHNILARLRYNGFADIVRLCIMFI